jgi:hypothetical protein
LEFEINLIYVAFRFKPDLLSPGDSLLSANAAGTDKTTCSTVQMTGKTSFLYESLSIFLFLFCFVSGTSMATPSAAGVALLVRQYFMDNSNRFWTAVCNHNYRSCHSFIPSGPLLKAILVHGGRKMKLFDGGGEFDVVLGVPPDFIQGFGRISLFQVLPLPQVVTNFDLFVADAVNIQENSQIAYKVQIKASNIPFK